MPFLRRRGHPANETDIRSSTAGVSESSQLSPDTPADADTMGEPDTTLSPSLGSHNVDSPLTKQNTADGGSREPSAQNSEDQTYSRPASPPIQAQTQRHRRFSALRFRNASDSQLSIRAKHEAEDPPPLPTPRMSAVKFELAGRRAVHPSFRW